MNINQALDRLKGRSEEDKAIAAAVETELEAAREWLRGRRNREREITVREHYAGLALQGMLANHEREASFKGYATDAVRFADALIKALEENQ